MMKVIFNLILALNLIFWVGVKTNLASVIAGGEIIVPAVENQDEDQNNDHSAPTELKQRLQREQQINQALHSVRGRLDGQPQAISSDPLQNQFLMNQAGSVENGQMNQSGMPANNIGNPSATNVPAVNATGNVANEHCRTLCGQYTNYNFATHLSNLVLGNNKMSVYYFDIVRVITQDSIQSPQECTAERLTPYLIGSNDRYVDRVIVQGMPTPRTHFNLCVKQCEQGGKGILYDPNNPAVQSLAEIIRMTQNMQTDQAFAAVAASGTGGF
ncbi:MAG: hypothetical protein Q8K36_02885 [Alphaproteobacteria bacterium]|nr:hypothetical protein [Alphaproteobacteria bacterium]